MPDGYVIGSSGMSYCNQTPFPPREGWGLGTRLERVWTLAYRGGGGGRTRSRAGIFADVAFIGTLA